jgi:hypothetical protein
MTEEFEGPFVKYIVHVVYRNYTERTTKFSMPASKVQSLVDQVIKSENVRAVTLAEVTMFCRNSFTEDYLLGVEDIEGILG